MIRWITYAACALVFVLLLAPARRSAESGSSKSYTSDDEPQNVDFPFSGEGPEANDIHIKWKQNVHVRGAKAYNPGDHPPEELEDHQELGKDWKLKDEKDENDTNEMTLTLVKANKDDKNLPAGGNLRLKINPLGLEFKDLVESYQWSLDGKLIGEEHKVSSTRGSGGVRSAKVATANGLRTVTFDTLQGRVVVNFPNDMRAGDPILSTLRADPKGQTEPERATNMAVLTGCVIEIEPPRKPDGTSNPKVTAQVTAALSPFTFTLPPSTPPKPPLTNVSSGSSGSLGITLTNTTGSFTVHGTTTIPIELVSLSLQSVAPLTVFQLPTIGQQGRPAVISGPFQVNGRTTLMYGPRGASVQDFEKNTENVSGGFGLIQPLAKSPRKCVFEAPTNVTGPIELYLKEGNIQTKGEYRNVGVNLSAPKTSLLKGEHTDLRVEVSGLQGIKEPVPLTLECKGVITMEGGTYQPLVIQPSQVSADGRYTTTRGITGVQAGVWGATATVVTHRFDVCLQDDTAPARRILWNTFNGDYIFINPFPPPKPSGQPPQTGSTSPPSLTGKGKIIMKGCILTLEHNAPDRRVMSRLDTCTNTGSTSVQTFSPEVKFTITDRSTTDNTCSMQ